MDTKIYVTKAGYNQYVAALEDCKKRYAEHAKTRADYGKNEVENYQTGAYDNEATILLCSIRDLTETISHLSIIENENTEEGTIGLEDIATIMFVDTGEIRQVKLTGGMPNIDKDNEVITITINSPMGKAIYKNKVGETVSYKVGNNSISVMIISKQNGLEKQENQPSNN